jgi:hypothetical protein
LRSHITNNLLHKLLILSSWIVMSIFVTGKYDEILFNRYANDGQFLQSNLLWILSNKIPVFSFFYKYTSKHPDLQIWLLVILFTSKFNLLVITLILGNFLFLDLVTKLLILIFIKSSFSLQFYLSSIKYFNENA